MNKIKNWMQAANGWKRLWFVLSVLGLLYAAVIYPLIVGKEVATLRNPYQAATAKEMNNPLCGLYQIKPLSELVEPKYTNEYGNEGCYHIYNFRKFNNPTKVPYTPEDLELDSKQAIRSEMLAWAGMGFLGSLVLSALVYFLGMVVAWVASGFRKSHSN